MTENAWLLTNYIQLYVWKWISDIGHFQICHDTLCLSSQILHRHCFHFLLGLAMVPRENENDAYAKFWRTSKEYYGIFESGLLGHSSANKHCVESSSSYQPRMVN